MMLVTLDDIKRYLREPEDDDLELQLLGRAASSAVMNYVGPQDWTDSNGDPIEDSNGQAIGAPDEVQWATLSLVGYLFRHRDEDPDRVFSMGFLPPAVTALLYPLRMPTLR